MDTTTPRAPVAQAPSSPRIRRFRIPRQRGAVPYELLPRQVARGQRRIRIECAINLIGRTKCGVAVAARAVGLGSDAMQELYDTLDFRKIPRKRKWGGSLRSWRTMECVEAYVTRPEPLKRGDQIWQPLLPSPTEEIASAPKRIVSACTVCGASFESKRKARYCGGACRIRHWRAQQ
jgi:hypothetical protein